MNRQETLAIMSILKAAYPSYYKGMKYEEANGVVNLWASMLSDYSYDEVAVAVKSLIATDVKGFPPHIGAVIDHIQRNRVRGSEMTEQEAWNLIDKATRNSGWRSQEEFDKLPPILQDLVGSPQQLKEWALMDANDVKTVVASNFQRSYRQKVAQQRDLAALPADVRDSLQALGGGMKMPGLMPWEVEK